MDHALAQRLRYGLLLRERDPLAFWHYANDTYRQATAHLASGLEVFIRSGNKGAKAQPIDEPILTPTGWREIGSLVIGDLVFGEDGKPHRVAGVFPQGPQEIVRLVFDDGAWTRCTLDHLWKVKTRKGRFLNGGWSVLTTQEILSRWGATPRPAQKVCIPLCEPIETIAGSLPLNPYLLGVLLGDGCFAPSGISFTTADQEVVDRVSTRLPESCVLREGKYPGRCSSYYFSSGRAGGDYRTRPRNPVLDSIRTLGLGNKHSWEKFIPEQYLYSSPSNRLELLRGLMDTDGTICERGHTVYCSVSRTLADQVRFLVRSLGGKATVRGRTTRFSYLGKKKEGRVSWLVSLRLRVCPFHLGRKSDRFKVGIKNAAGRLLETVLPDGVGECVCILVDSPDGTYITRDFIVTHNTNYGSAVVVAMLQGRAELDGVTLPQLPPHAIGGVLVLDHQQQVMSVQPAYLAHLGDWPHEVGWKSRANNIIGTLKIKPLGGSDDRRKWSILHFISQENPNATVGARFHLAHADEPPKEHIWNEVRARGFGEGQPFFRIITATPLVRRQWSWLKKHFPEEYTGTPYKGRIELRVSVYDNQFLTEADKAALEDLYRDDPLREARLHGDYIDASGKCPFDPSTLAFLLQKCQPFRVQVFRVVRESDTSIGRTNREENVEVEILEDRDPEETYYIPLDASAGIDDNRHDPCCLHVWSRGIRGVPRLVARYNGYLGAYGLGALAAELGKHYNHALVDPETSGGWGAPALSALAACGYGNVAKAKRELRPGEWAVELGFKTSEATRPAMISSLQEWIRSERDRAPIASIRHGEVIRCLQDIVLNEKGKPIAAPGLHDEDMILAGQALRRLAIRRRIQAPIQFGRPYLYVPREKTLDDFLHLKKPTGSAPREVVRLNLPGKSSASSR